MARLTRALLLHKQSDGNALLYVEDVFILGAIRSLLLLQRVAVQVKYMDLIERSHKRLPHAAESRIVEVAVVRNESENAFTDLIYLPLCKSYKLDIIVLQPLRILFAQRLPIYFLVRLDLPGNPSSLVRRVAGVWRVSENHQYRLVLLYPACKLRFLRERFYSRYSSLGEVLHLQRIGEIEIEPLVTVQFVSEFFQEVSHLQMSRCIRGHHQLESVEVLEYVIHYKFCLRTTSVLGRVVLHGELRSFGKESQRSACRIKHRHALTGKAIPAFKLLFQNNVQ